MIHRYYAMYVCTVCMFVGDAEVGRWTGKDNTRSAPATLVSSDAVRQIHSR